MRSAGEPLAVGIALLLAVVAPKTAMSQSSDLTSSVLLEWALRAAPSLDALR